MDVDAIWFDARLATASSPHSLSIVERGSVACRDGRIAWVGAMDAIPADLRARERIDCAGRWITPGLIDCHTHLVFAGDSAVDPST